MLDDIVGHLRLGDVMDHSIEELRVVLFCFKECLEVTLSLLVDKSVVFILSDFSIGEHLTE